MAMNGAGGKSSGLAALAAEAAAIPTETIGGVSSHDEPIKPVNKKEERPAIAGREKVYPKLISGRYRKIKWVVMIITLTIYYVTPWIRWERPGDVPDQAVLIDFQAQRLYFFFIEIWPQEFYYITGLLIVAALSLFLVTSVAGRVWCGYSCPQTVWTDLFVHIERWVEGDRNQRMRLDKAPWTLSKLVKKTVKHMIWILVAMATGGAWIFYYADAPTLWNDFFAGRAPITAYVSMVGFTISTYLLGAIAREQVCTYMCPWPRIQGAMFDEDSFLVSYRTYRGEPRGPHKKGASWEGRGDCVSCRQCVAVCPMGIDIRDGTQLECIQCALCIDACNDIMKKIGRPQNLIAYETSRNLQHGAKGERFEVHLLRPRTIVYGSVILGIVLLMAVALALRSTMDVNLIRDRNPVFVQMSDGGIRNGYTIRILNKEHFAQTFDISVTGLDGAVLTNGTVGADPSDHSLTVDADTHKAAKFFITVPREMARSAPLRDGTEPVIFTITNRESGKTASETSVFRGPKS